MKTSYIKPALSFPAQIALLKSRGLLIENESEALHFLTHINYYRLSAYIYPFLKNKEEHLFKEGTTFKNVVDIYNFDRELRLLILDAMERIEVSIRTSTIYVLSNRHNPFWISNEELFYNKESYKEHYGRIKDEINRSDEKFIQHYYTKYSEIMPPAWITLEIASFGLLSIIISNLKNQKDVKEIAARYGLPHRVFISWLHSLTYIRNLCAHHSRLWNRELGIKPYFPRTIGGVWLKDQDELRNDRIFIIIAIVLYFLSIINPGNSFKKQLHLLLEKHPMIDLAPMGFPKNWENEELFNSK